MGALSKLSGKCKACPKVDTCNYKKMELCGYLETLESLAMPVMEDISASEIAPIMRETMLVNDGFGNMVRVYKDDIEKEIYKSLRINSIGLNFGA